MSSFASILAADAQFISNDASAGDTVVYKPKTGSPVTVNVVVNRLPAAPISGTSPPRFAPAIEIFWPAGLGIVAIDKDGDRIVVAARQGGTPVPHMINEIVNADAGGWLLRLH